MVNRQLLGQRLAGWYTSLAIILLNIIVILVGLDCAAWVASKAHTSLVPGPAHAGADPRARSPFYQSQPWAAAYWREFELSRPMRYQPFVLHRRAPFTGETINIDHEGIRVTPGADCGPQALKVFTFGGSTMWGTGAPDWGTIPSYLLREMQKRKNGPLCVVNFGESAYVSTQSVIELLLQLQAGHIPDVTLFLDGVNDIYAAYQSGRAGLHQNFAQVAARFEGRGGASQKLLEFSHLYVLAKRLATTLHQARSSTPSLLTYETMGVDADSLSQAIIQTYLGNYQMVEGLAQQYGFRAFFFWPPHVLMGAKPLTPEEGELKRSIDPAQAKLYRSVYRQIEPLVPAYKHLTYLGAIFDHCDFLLWLDDLHFTPVGNELIARKMLEVLTH